MRLIIFCLLMFLTLCTTAQQVGINNTTPDPSAVLDIQANNRGLLIPRMDKASRNAILNPAKGLMVYQSGPDSIGFYYYHSNWNYINYDSMLPPSSIVLSETNPNPRLLNNNFKYNGQLNIPNATVTVFLPSATNIWMPIDSTPAIYPPNGTVDLFSTWADSVYILAGGFSGVNNGISFYKFNPTSSKWQMVNSNFIPLGAAQARVGNKWVFWGGIFSSGGPVNNNALQASIFDVGSYTITQSVLPNDSARRFHTANAVGNNIYFWGGLSMTSNTYVYNTGYKYDVVANTWTLMSNAGAPGARYHAGSVTAGSDVVIWGGYNPTGGILNTGGIYRTATNAWVTMSAVNAPTTGTIEPAMAYYNSNVYIISGLQTKRFDPFANTWTTLAAPPFSFSGQKFTYDGNGKIYVWGGAKYFFAGAPSNVGYVYDIVSNSYTTLPTNDAPVARAGHTLCYGAGGFLVWGGSNSTGSNPTTIQSLKSGGLFYLNASNVYVTQPLGNLFMYEKK